MSSFIRRMDRLSDALAVVAACLLAMATAVICWMVAYRTMGYSTSWELELGIFLMVCALFLGSPYTLKTKGHVGVDLMASMLPDRYARSLQFGVLIVGLLVVLFLAWLGLEFSLHAFEKGERTESVWAPYKWPLYATMPIGFGITALQYLAEIQRHFLRQEHVHE
ncbi:MAG: TRAP transporter small permease subunit [Burkholderiaceae bacterium]